MNATKRDPWNDASEALGLRLTAPQAELLGSFFPTQEGDWFELALTQLSADILSVSDSVKVLAQVDASKPMGDLSDECDRLSGRAYELNERLESLLALHRRMRAEMAHGVAGGSKLRAVSNTEVSR